MYKKIIRAFFIFIVLANICVAQTNSLSKPISYTAQQKPIGEILQDLEVLSNAYFTYNSALIDISEKVSISVREKKLEDILTILFLQKFTYKQIGSQILITPRASEQLAAIEKPKQTKIETQEKKPPPIQDTILIYDTIIHTSYDTIIHLVYDTICVIDSSEFYLSKQISQRKHAPTITIAALWGSQLSYPLFWNKQTNDYARTLQNTESQSLGTYQGVFITQQLTKSTFGLGIQNIHFAQNTKFSTSQTTDNDTYTYIDSLWFWQYQLLFTYYKFVPGGDSVLVPVYDSIYTYRLVENPKKVVTTTHYKSRNSYRYIGIPISYGYRHFITEAIEIQPSFVINPLIRIHQSGLYPNKDNSNAIPLKDAGLRRITYAIGFTWNAMWHLNKNYSVHVKPSCFSTPIFTKKKNAGFQKSNLIFGFEWGVSYSFPYKIQINSELFK